MTHIQNWLLTLGKSRNVPRDLRTRRVETHQGLSSGTSRVLHVRSRGAFAMRHLRPVDPTRSARRLHRALRTTLRV